ncbi:MAG: ABC transporter ATP-binding protein [Bacteroidota bacterium]|jgi:ABC-2 type transport system ATP-binding protein
MKTPIIEIDHLVKQFRHAERPSLNGINLTIYEGEKLGVFGPNGAGKTTLISILCNIISPTTGNVYYKIAHANYSIKQALPMIGFVPQDFALYPELTPVQCLNYFGALYRIKKNSLRLEIDVLLEKLGLLHVRQKKIYTFSGGMKRRMNLAIGLINKPKILFLDEPTVGVDVQSKLSIMMLLDELNKSGTTIIYTSHHLKESESFCDRIALIDKGDIIALGPLADLLKKNKAQNLEDLLIDLTGKQLRD